MLAQEAPSLSDPRIKRARASPGQWTGAHEDEVLLRSVDRLLVAGWLDDAMLANLGTVLDDAGITDLMATIGLYTTLAFIVRTFPPPIDEFVRDAS